VIFGKAKTIVFKVKCMSNQTIVIRDAMSSEFSLVGQLMVEVYAGLKGFPKPTEQPAYYKMLSAVGELTLKPDTALRVAVLNDGTIAGAVVYFGDMQYYGSGGTATQEKNSAGFRLLAVNPEFRGGGIGKLLTLDCIQRAKAQRRVQMIIHTTMAMRTAWAMYEKLGFQRSVDLDFMQGELAVFGFRLPLNA